MRTPLSEYDSEREFVFVWEVIGYDRQGRAVAMGGGATQLEAKLDLVRDVPAATARKIAWCKFERVLVDWRRKVNA